MPGSIVKSGGQSLIPTIDIGPFLSDTSSPSAKAVIEQISEACMNVGFFQIVGHGMPQETIDGLLSAAKKFFDLPMEEKLTLDATKTVGRRGYDVLASQSYDTGVLPDLKEGFYVGPDVPNTDRVVQPGRYFMGSNVWPTSLSFESFREPVERYFAEVSDLALTILDLVGKTLPYNTDIFRQFSNGHVITPLRLLHYPPAPAGRGLEDGVIQFGAGAHTDFGAITLLAQDENPGLEIWSAESQAFVPVDPMPGAFVVNIGDVLSAWTSGRYKSSIHRVINKNPVDRYSAAFFFNGSLDCPLDPLDGSAPLIEGLTVEKYMIKRMAETYKKPDNHS
ncbi:putative 2OG-Fe(II) oxygenase family oxidoreductase [Xylariaceae sp. FL0255]|nr:putative 2OG-Fe(II) oxygenase family oxidoreductase [Xylariaceae sp. FL0255]